jgi:arsenite methyltransferase
MSEQDLRSTVRTAYAKIALESADACCVAGETPGSTALVIGYTEEQLAALPEGANLGLGCGNPLALASIREGDTVLDLGSGAGIDCFLAAHGAGATGHVIGVDMTMEMLDRANHNKAAVGATNVEFRYGELEALPVDDSSVDLVISNCVINLVPDRDRVYREVMRVLKPGGRVSVSDTIQTMALPQALLETEAAKAACISAAVTKEVYLASLTDAGFEDVAIESEVPYPADLGFEQALLEGLRDNQGIPEEVIKAAARSMVSIAVTATKAV